MSIILDRDLSIISERFGGPCEHFDAIAAAGSYRLILSRAARKAVELGGRDDNFADGKNGTEEKKPTDINDGKPKNSEPDVHSRYRVSGNRGKNPNRVREHNDGESAETRARSFIVSRIVSAVSAITGD